MGGSGRARQDRKMGQPAEKIKKKTVNFEPDAVDTVAPPQAGAKSRTVEKAKAPFSQPARKTEYKTTEAESQACFGARKDKTTEEVRGKRAGPSTEESNKSVKDKN